MKREASPLTGIVLAAISAISFGTLAISAKLAYREGADPVALLAARFWFAAILLFAYNAVTGRSLRIGRPGMVRLALLGGLAYAFEATLYFAALTKASAAVVGLVFYSYPLWTALAGFATRLEPFHPRLLVALALGTGGVVVIFSLPSSGLAGPLLALAAAFAVTVYYLLAQVFVRGVDAAAAATYTAGGAAVSLTVISLVLGHELPLGAIRHAAGLGLATAIAFVCLYGAVILIGSARTAVTHMLEPVTTVILAALILGDAISWRIAVGAALIVSALPILATQKRPSVPAPDGP